MVLVFDVASRPLGLPVQLDGIAWWYEGDSLIPMPEEIRRRVYEESGFDFSGSICAGAKLDNLDEEAIEDFRSRWMEKSGNKRLISLSAEQLLCDCEAVTERGSDLCGPDSFWKERGSEKTFASGGSYI